MTMPFWTSFYELGPIRDLLSELVDFDAIMASPTRLVVTATNIETGDIEAFDNTGKTGPLTIDHVLASGSLPPGFPMTPIGDAFYWDGGLFDNTPLSPLIRLIDPMAAPRTKLFVINLFPKAGKIPKDMIAVSDRMVELLFANKMHKDVDMAKTINTFVALIDEMVAAHPEVRHLLDRPEFEDLRRYKALSDIVEITNTRDEPVSAASDFSRAAIGARIEAGYADADAALAAKATQEGRGGMSGLERYTGGCHCGAVRYEASVDLANVVTCNCSRCAKLGWIMTFTPAANFKLVSGEGELTEYTFNRKVIRHRFCRVCGIEPFAYGVPPGADVPVAAINVRCLDGVDPAALQPRHFDGKSL